MRERKTDEYKVGIFASVGLFIFILTVVLLGGDKAFFTKHTLYKLRLDSVEGLGEGSVVQLAGLKVGNIKSIVFNHEKNFLEVELKIESKFASRITQGSQGGTRTQGALGDKFIYITPGPIDAPRLENGEFLLTESDKDLFSTIARRGDEIQKVFDILNELHAFAAGLNTEGGSKTLVHNLNATTEELRKAASLLAAIGKDIRGEKDSDNKLKQSLAHFSSIMEKIDKGQGTLGGLINDASIHEKLKDLLGASDRKKSIRGLIRDTIEKGKAD